MFRSLFTFDHNIPKMKLLPILLFLFLFFHVSAQTTSSTVTMAGIGDIKLGMKKAEFEKLLNQSFQLPHVNGKDNDYYQDTVHVNYKGIDEDVIFQKQYNENDK